MGESPSPPPLLVSVAPIRNDCQMSNVSALRAPERRSLRAANREPSHWAYRVIAHFARLVNPLVSRRRWAGQEHIPKTGGVILVANHTSNYDPLALGEFIIWAGRWPRFLGKSEIWNVPGLGWFARKCEQIPVFRNTDRAINSLVHAEEALLTKHHAVAIYPEGTITADPDVWPMTGRRGAAQLALKTGVPVVPLVAVGPPRVLGQKKLELGKLLGGRKPVSVMARPALDLSAYTDVEPTKAVLDEVTALILDTLTEMVAEIRGEQPPAEGRYDMRLGRRVGDGAVRPE